MAISLGVVMDPIADINFYKDTTLALLLDGSTSVRVPFDQAIWSAGWVDLGQSNKLHRYYMNDEDFWLQIHVTGDDQIESVTLFNYLSYVTVNSDAELQRLAGPASPIGLPSYTHDGIQYSREWGTEQGQTELVPLTEHVVNPDESYTIEHHSMLYARETGWAAAALATPSLICASSAGASSPITCCITTRTRPSSRWTHASSVSPGPRTRPCSRPGSWGLPSWWAVPMAPTRRWRWRSPP